MIPIHFFSNLHTKRERKIRNMQQQNTFEFRFHSLKVRMCGDYVKA